VRATIWGMRATFAALALGFILAAAGCGGTTSATRPAAGSDAAALVPPDAIAFVRADANLDSQQWRSLTDLIGPIDFPSGADYAQTIKPAIGDQLNLAVLGVEQGKPEAIAIVKTNDEAKLRALASKFDQGDEHYTVERVGDWSVVADSAEAFAAVRSAQSGRSLADVPAFQSATGRLDSSSLAAAFVDGSRLGGVSDKAGSVTQLLGSPRWLTAQVTSQGDAVRLDARAGTPKQVHVAYRPQLLRDVPSGALLAVSFKDANVALKRVAGTSSFSDALAELKEYTGISAAQLAPALRGEGVYYVTQSTLLPTLVLEVESPNPAATVRTFRTVAANLSAKAGNVLQIKVFQRGKRVYLTNASTVPSTSGGSLVDDKAFKDALAAAGAPAAVTWLAYADVKRLAPIVQVLSQLLGGSASSRQQGQKLDRLGTLVAYGAPAGPDSRVSVRITHR
jgi:hypothetical protein